MSTHVPGFLSFFMFLHHFVLAKLATSSTRVNFLEKLADVFKKDCSNEVGSQSAQ